VKKGIPEHVSSCIPSIRKKGKLRRDGGVVRRKIRGTEINVRKRVRDQAEENLGPKPFLSEGGEEQPQLGGKENAGKGGKSSGKKGWQITDCFTSGGRRKTSSRGGN